MKLNSASFNTLNVNGKICDSMEEFISELKSRSNLVADVYVANSSGQLHLLLNSKIHFISMNGYLVASIDGMIALSEPAYIHRVEINVYESGKSDTYTMTSYTDVNEIIETDDVDVDLYFLVGNITPYNTKKQSIPKSRFHRLGTHRMMASKLEDLPTDSSIEVDLGSQAQGAYESLTATATNPGTNGNYEVSINITQNGDNATATVTLTNDEGTSIFEGPILISSDNDNQGEISIDSLNSLTLEGDSQGKLISDYVIFNGSLYLSDLNNGSASFSMTGGQEPDDNDPVPQHADNVWYSNNFTVIIDD